MGYLYRPKLKDGPAAPHGQRCCPKKHGRADTCPGCGARFSHVCWAKYYVDGIPVRESTRIKDGKEAERFLKR